MAQNSLVYCFGPFKLSIKQRLLLKDGVPVELGGRALDLLIALVSRPNESISKRELLSQVWSDVAVEEASLRVHIAALRRALGDGEDGARYIVTLAGRGYCFVTPVSVSSDQIDGSPPPRPAISGIHLPARLKRMIGRDSSIHTLAALLEDSRFVTVVGSGGVGKTTLAVAVAHEMLEAFAGAVAFVDLGSINDPDLIAPSIASLLGLSVQSDDPTPSLIAFLRDKRVLLILDNCEHVIEAAADIAMRIYLAAAQVHILATSREALRVEGEQVYKLMPLTVPPDERSISAKAALTYSAIQLFVERAAASGTRLDLTDADAAIVAGICRKLDGLALAIELAAGRVGTYGLQQTLTLLDQRLTMLWLGQRTAPPRQKTLRAMLDWSYELLSNAERAVLRRLAVFVGPFTVEAALAVVASPTIDEVMVFSAIDSLVAKSMVAARPSGAAMRYRLSETTRAYALELNADEAEFADLAARHARYYRRWLEETAVHWPTQSRAPERAALLAELANVRAALEWCFGPRGDGDIGIGLASAAVPLFLALSLLTECLRWSERALMALRGADLEEMHLQAALGMSLMFTRGNGDNARIALDRSLSISQSRGDPLGELRSLSLLHMYHRRTGDYRAALSCAERSTVPAGITGQTSAQALAHALLGISLYHIGDLNAARHELQAALERQQGTDWTSTFLLGFDLSSLASSILARTLWLQGHPVQAVELARRTVAEAARMDHPLTLAIAFTWALSIFIWVGDLQSAEEVLGQSLAHSEAHSLTPNVMQARGFRGEIELRRGNLEGGIRNLQDCLKELRTARYELLATPFSLALAQGLTTAGRCAEAIAMMDEAIAIVEASGELVYMPELLRVKARALAAHSAQQQSLDTLMRSIDLSRRQGARSWELRATIDLAALQASRNLPHQSRNALQAVFESFTEGHDTADLKTARGQLSTLG